LILIVSKFGNLRPIKSKYQFPDSDSAKELIISITIPIHFN
jgi:hypothetical protein